MNYCLQLPPWWHVCLRIEFGALISCICVLRQWNKRARGMRASWLLDMTYILELHRSYKSTQPTPMVAWFVDISNQSMNLRLGFLHQMCPHPRPSPFLCHVHACTCGEEEDKGYARHFWSINPSDSGTWWVWLWLWTHWAAHTFAPQLSSFVNTQLILSTLCLRVLFRHSKLGSPLASFSNMVSHFLFCFFQEWQIIPPFTLWPWIVLSPPNDVSLQVWYINFFSPNKQLINHSILLVFYLN